MYGEGWRETEGQNEGRGKEGKCRGKEKDVG